MNAKLAVEQVSAARKPRILVCDDSSTQRRQIQLLLGSAYELLLVESADEATRRAIAFGPDLIISDLIMPGMDGYGLCRWIRATPELQNVPVVLLTSETADDSRALGLEVGADDYLFKPVRQRELIARVTSLLRLGSVMRELTERTLELTANNESLEKAKLELVRSEKLASLGQLVAGIAHELNNPINYVLGNCRVLKDYLRTLMGLVDGLSTVAETDAQRKHVQKLLAQADITFLRSDLFDLTDSVARGAARAADIVRGLRAFARHGSGEMGPVHIVPVMEEVLAILRHEFRDRLGIHWEIGEQLPAVNGDSTRLGQVFTNLLMNACQAVVGRGDIFIGVVRDGSFIRCSIRDTGPGMTPEVKAKIFDPFFTTKPVGTGTGLGLSISYGIVEEHGGRIEVESGPAGGATFTVFLPTLAAVP